MPLGVGTAIDFITGTSFRLALGGVDPIGVVVSANVDVRSEVLTWAYLSWQRRVPKAAGGTELCEIVERRCGFNTVYLATPGLNRTTDRIVLLFPSSYRYQGITGEYFLDLP